jgi:hypothetical protein
MMVIDSMCSFWVRSATLGKGLGLGWGLGIGLGLWLGLGLEFMSTAYVSG